MAVCMDQESVHLCPIYTYTIEDLHKLKATDLNISMQIASIMLAFSSLGTAGKEKPNFKLLIIWHSTN